MHFQFASLLLVGAMANQAMADNYVVSQMSVNFINIMTKFKSDKVDAAKASSEANYMFTEVMNYPPIVKVQEDIAKENVLFVPEAEKKQLIEKYSKETYDAWNQFKSSPKYSQYTKNVKQYLEDFDVDKLVDDALSISSKYNTVLTQPYHKAVSDPGAKSMFSTWCNEGKQFVTDIGLAPHLKGKVPGLAKRHDRYDHHDDHYDEHYHDDHHYDDHHYDDHHW